MLIRGVQRDREQTPGLPFEAVLLAALVPHAGAAVPAEDVHHLFVQVPARLERLARRDLTNVGRGQVPGAIELYLDCGAACARPGLEPDVVDVIDLVPTNEVQALLLHPRIEVQGAGRGSGAPIDRGSSVCRCGLLPAVGRGHRPSTTRHSTGVPRFAHSSSKVLRRKPASSGERSSKSAWLPPCLALFSSPSLRRLTRCLVLPRRRARCRAGSLLTTACWCHHQLGGTIIVPRPQSSLMTSPPSGQSME